MHQPIALGEQFLDWLSKLGWHLACFYEVSHGRAKCLLERFLKQCVPLRFSHTSGSLRDENKIRRRNPFQFLKLPEREADTL